MSGPDGKTWLPVFTERQLSLEDYGLRLAQTVKLSRSRPCGRDSWLTFRQEENTRTVPTVKPAVIAGHIKLDKPSLPVSLLLSSRKLPPNQTYT